MCVRARVRVCVCVCVCEGRRDAEDGIWYVCDVLPFHMACCMASMYVGSDCECACVSLAVKL